MAVTSGTGVPLAATAAVALPAGMTAASAIMAIVLSTTSGQTKPRAFSPN